MPFGMANRLNPTPHLTLVSLLSPQPSGAQLTTQVGKLYDVNSNIIPAWGTVMICDSTAEAIKATVGDQEYEEGDEQYVRPPPPLRQHAASPSNC